MDNLTIISICVSFIIALIAAALAGHIKLLNKEMNELISAITIAVGDKKITRVELEVILKEATDVKDVVISIMGLVTAKHS